MNQKSCIKINFKGGLRDDFLEWAGTKHAFIGIKHRNLVTFNIAFSFLNNCIMKNPC